MKRGSGFTLIEVLIVMAILAVLVVIAYPGYAGYITKTRRIEGQIALHRSDPAAGALLHPHQHLYRLFVRLDRSGGKALQVVVRQRRGEQRLRTERARLPGPRADAVRRGDGHAGHRQGRSPSSGTPTAQTLTLNSAGERTSSGPIERCWP